MEIKIVGTPEEVKELLQAIGSSKEQTIEKINSALGSQFNFPTKF